VFANGKQFLLHNITILGIEWYNATFFGEFCNINSLHRLKYTVDYVFSVKQNYSVLITTI